MKSNTKYLQLAIITILLLAIPIHKAQAQNGKDAWRYSEYDYIGSARTFSMGNAFTALGGDLGSISLNPAGSATAGFSQVTFTPGFDVTNSQTKGRWEYNNSNATINQVNSSFSSFDIPNVGVVIDFQLNNNFLSGISFGFVSNMTNSFTEKSQAHGFNRETSFLSALAQAASDMQIDNSVFSKSDCYDNYPIDLCVAYKTDMITNITGTSKKYVAVTEDCIDNGDGTYDIMLRNGGDLEQSWGREVSGYRNDYVFNLGFNFSGKLFLGVNLGVSNVRYSYEDFFKESAIDMTKYSCEYTIDENTYNTNWKSGKYSYHMRTNGTGVYGKFGLIYIPTKFLRIGAAIQTPTRMSVVEQYGAYAVNTFDYYRFGGTEESPTYRNEFSLLSPMRANFGIAGIINEFWVLSADYEFCPYGSMNLGNRSRLDNSEWAGINEEIRNQYTTGHNLRIGTEFNFGNTFFVRGGYNLLTNPSIHYNAENGKSSQDISNISKYAKQTFSFGVGYNSKGSFFVDLAVGMKLHPFEFVYPYDDIHDIGGAVVAAAPELFIQRQSWTGLVTLGWRF